MKCFIKTAHGYLSFQPPLGGTPNGQATMQYRESAGAWEELDITAWDYETVPPPDGGTTPPASEDWLGIPPSPTADYVAAVKATLDAQGVNLSGPCGAFAIVENVAWGLRESGCGTFYKPSGNNCQERSTDVVCYKDLAYGVARIYDILGDAGGMNTPMWGEKGPEPIENWRPAEQPLNAEDASRRSRARKAAKG